MAVVVDDAGAQQRMRLVVRVRGDSGFDGEDVLGGCNVAGSKRGEEPGFGVHRGGASDYTP